MNRLLVQKAIGAATLFLALSFRCPTPAFAADPEVALHFANKGTVVIELFPKQAPKTVAHILELVRKKFYNGIKVHRVEPGFVVQLGDPETKGLPPSQFATHAIGTHGSGTTVPLEAGLPNNKGTVGLARTQDPNSGDSQFYFNLSNNNFLDGKYCVFGKVVRGMNVVEHLQIGDTLLSAEILPQEKPHKTNPKTRLPNKK
ncbi:peptidylprolyl isomerase [Chthonomonas calidirosea]|uniref:peptidylprolyl isomerase n=1 Tax=Chthonomonas calidirosea TaxID=454171 RepID=UPI0006EC86BB|nr:peptidylprolyl isomerase [Chthonomonas calidirosea]CEK19608.1 peptidyl-prolyl cis-trans isomerase (rotamase)-cyclophilin family [Chthonomonas calidirosea]